MEDYVTIKTKDLQLIMSRMGKYLTYEAIKAGDSIKDQLKSQNRNEIYREETKRIQINN